jgi:hypothetical protein
MSGLPRRVQREKPGCSGCGLDHHMLPAAKWRAAADEAGSPRSHARAKVLLSKSLSRLC